MLIFSPHKKKYIWYLPKKVNFLFLSYTLRRITESIMWIVLGFASNLSVSMCSLGIKIGVCT